MTQEYSHFTLLADGAIIEPNAEFDTEPGPAVMAMKAWARDSDEAADMFIGIANHLGFKIEDSIELFETEPVMAAEDRPFGYDIQFTPYSEQAPTLQ